LTRKQLLAVTLVILTGATLVASGVLLIPFLPALTWALSLAIIAYPVHAWIESHVQNRQIAAGLAVVGITVLLVVPIVLVGVQIANEAVEGGQQFQSWAASGAPQSVMLEHPMLASIVTFVQTHIDVGDALTQGADSLQRRLGRIVKGGVWSFMQLAIALYTLFFFFRDREHMLGALRSMMPLSDGETDEVFDSVRSMVRATIYGNVATSILQGTLGGLVFWFLGLPGALLWGAAMFLLSLVPSLGSFLVWAPTAAILAATGNWSKAGILVGWGIFVVGTIDNLVYPFLVGRDIRMHTLAVFFSLLGGLVLLGASGIVLGPVLMAVALALLGVVRRRTEYGRPAELKT
jgi:predicted PurR-regulated permease PerM